MGETKERNKDPQFPWLAGYYRRFIEGFSRIATLLTSLTRKDIKFVWDDSCESTFVELKQKLTSAPILTVPDSQEPYMLYKYALGTGLGCVLIQHRNVAAYASR